MGMDPTQIIQTARSRLAENPPAIPVAVNGCVVNGSAAPDRCDVAMFTGKGRAVIWVRGERAASVGLDDAVDGLLREVRKLCDQSGSGT